MIRCLTLSHAASAVSEESIPTVRLKGTQESSGSAGASLLPGEPSGGGLGCRHLGHECSSTLWKSHASPAVVS